MPAITAPVRAIPLRPALVWARVVMGAAVIVVGLDGCASDPASGAAASTTARPAPPGSSGPLGAVAANAPTGPTARLLLRGAAPGDDRYAVFELADSSQCKGPKMLASGSAKKGPDPAALAAGSLTTLDFVVLRADKPLCGVRWSFTPEAGKTYLVQGLVLGSGCTARLLDATRPEQPAPPADAVQRSGPGQACIPLAQARAAVGAVSLIQGGQHNGEAVLLPNATARDLQGLIRP